MGNVSSLILCSSGGSCGLGCCLWAMYHHLYCVVQVVVVVVVSSLILCSSGGRLLFMGNVSSLILCSSGGSCGLWLIVI